MVQVFLFVPMKNKFRSLLTSAVMVFTASLFIKAGCSKSSDDVDVAPPSNSDQYVTWNINGKKGYLASPNDSLWVTTSFGPTILFGNTPYTAAQNIGFYAQVNSKAAGTFPASQMVIYSANKYYVSTSNAPQINIATFGAVGDYITGSYTGTLKDSTSTATYPISGVFKVKRQ